MSDKQIPWLFWTLIITVFPLIMAIGMAFYHGYYDDPRFQVKHIYECPDELSEDTIIVVRSKKMLPSTKCVLIEVQ